MFEGLDETTTAVAETITADKNSDESEKFEDPKLDDAKSSNRDAVEARERLQVEWFEEDTLEFNFAKLGSALAATGDVFRPALGEGKLLAASWGGRDVDVLQDPAKVDAAVADRLEILHLKNGKIQGRHIPSRTLKAMLHTQNFLQHFTPVAFVSATPCFTPDFALCRPGINRSPNGNVFFAGEAPVVGEDTETVERFLDAIPFASEADRTATVAAALVRLLRNLWPGGKPLVLVTANKSHSGKTTVVDFLGGTSKTATITYEATDWAFRTHFVKALSGEDPAVINVDNARLERGRPYIASAFLEGFLTDGEPSIATVKDKGHVKISNHVVASITTNFGAVSTDLYNRSLPIHLHLEGGLDTRIAKYGNLRQKFLPANREIMESEILGMVERWKGEGMPMADDINHPFTACMRTLGGILAVSGYKEFLANVNIRKTAEDPVRGALALLAAERPDEWRRPMEWVATATDLGLVGKLVPSVERESLKSCERAIGVVLSAHAEEILHYETDEGVVRFALRKQRMRRDGSQPQIFYEFARI